MSDKLKKYLAIGGLILVHLAVTFFLNAASFAHALSLVHQPEKTIPLPPIVRLATTVAEFPLVPLTRLISYSPASQTGSLVAFIYLLAYFVNSFLWATVIYTLSKFAISYLRALRRG